MVHGQHTTKKLSTRFTGVSAEQQQNKSSDLDYVRPLIFEVQSGFLPHRAVDAGDIALGFLMLLCHFQMLICILYVLKSGSTALG